MSYKPDKKKGYAFVDNAWIFDDRIKTELRLLIYISSLTAKDGYAYASNEHLAKEFKTTNVTISRQIAKLIDLGYLKAEYERYGSVIQKRYLRLTKLLTDHYQECKPTVNKNVKDNITSINNTSNNRKKDKPSRSRFKKPKLEDVYSYMAEEKNKEKSFAKKESEKFIDFYESNGWKVGKNKMVSWKHAVSNWINRAEEYTKKGFEKPKPKLNKNR